MATSNKMLDNLAAAFRASVKGVEEIEYKASGGAAHVFRLKIKGAPERALKILNPEQARYADVSDDFEEEGQLLSEITHPRIVKGFGLGKPLVFEGVNLPWYTMEYFPHDDLGKVLRRTQTQNPLPRKFSVYISLLRQTLEALQYLHSLSPPRCHLDVKEANLLIDMTHPEDPLIKLSDFGVSKPISSIEGDTDLRGSLFYWPRKWQDLLKGKIPSIVNRTRLRLPRADIPTAVDLHMLSVAFKSILETLFVGDDDSYWYRAISLILARMNWDARDKLTTIDDKYMCVTEGAEASKALEDLLILERTPALPSPLEESGSLRLPINSLRGFGPGIQCLLDLQWFQRLRHVRQLGATHLVYPGAVHSRFEHMVGAYHQTLRYIQALLDNKNSPWFGIHFSLEEIRALALTSLCHDLGHYSFAHQLEDLSQIDVWPKHERLSFDILNGNITATFPELASALGDPEKIRRIIEDEWEIDFDLVLSMFAYCFRSDLNEKGIQQKVPRGWRAAGEIINGPIDADKFDYLRRDSHHSGVSYGLVNDPSRFLSSLTIAFDNVGGTRLAVTEKGRVDVEFIAVARYAMFSEVYWHHTVRAFTAMVRKALELAFAWKENPLTIGNLFQWSDDWVLHQLKESAGQRAATDVLELVEHVSCRRPYARLFTLTKEDSEELYQKLTARREDMMRGNMWEEDEALVGKSFGITGMRPHHLLWDIPKPGKDQLTSVPIADIHGNVVQNNPGPLWGSLSANFEKWVRKIRLFVHPDFRPKRLSREAEIERYDSMRSGLAERFL
ncbi:MAG: protein kinase [Hyphomicrobiales bacterium]|nr:protein kinase [Hyphomicrobiales bacterium]MBV8826102.1 protein kinase [Hyphomicrobiales bacterium]MBV9429199.1 protein kinase [Bradyrhizobiaceae bacterium]